MSVVTELMYNTLNAIKQECKNAQRCGDCKFGSGDEQCGLISDKPQSWDIDNIVDTIYESNYYRR